MLGCSVFWQAHCAFPLIHEKLSILCCHLITEFHHKMLSTFACSPVRQKWQNNNSKLYNKMFPMCVMWLTLRVHSSGVTVTPTRGGSISPNNKKDFTVATGYIREYSTQLVGVCVQLKCGTDFQLLPIATLDQSITNTH